MGYRLAVIGVGNMAKAIVGGIQKNSLPIEKIILFDKNSGQLASLPDGNYSYEIADCITAAVRCADCVLLSVKPQNFDEVLDDITAVEGHSDKIYISIAAGITQEYISRRLNGAGVVRALPNLPMTICEGVTLICRNDLIPIADFSFVHDLFVPSGNTVVIDENDMNRLIGVTSSSPAYVFKFIDAIYKGAIAQGLDGDGLIDAICDVFIGSAKLLKSSGELPEALIAKVASKGGTTERALCVLEECEIDPIIEKAMIACTARADELGGGK